MKKQIAISLVANALALKTSNVGVKVFINTCRNASTDNLCELLIRIRNGKDVLTNAYQDNLNRWHFATV